MYSVAYNVPNTNIKYRTGNAILLVFKTKWSVTDAECTVFSYFGWQYKSVTIFIQEAGMCVPKAPVIHFLASKSAIQPSFESHLYLAGVVAFTLQRYQSDMCVIFNKWSAVKSFWKIGKWVEWQKNWPSDWIPLLGIWLMQDWFT